MTFTRQELDTHHEHLRASLLRDHRFQTERAILRDVVAELSVTQPVVARRVQTVLQTLELRARIIETADVPEAVQEALQALAAALSAPPPLDVVRPPEEQPW